MTIEADTPKPGRKLRVPRVCPKHGYLLAWAGNDGKVTNYECPVLGCDYAEGRTSKPKQAKTALEALNDSNADA